VEQLQQLAAIGPRPIGCFPANLYASDRHLLKLALGRLTMAPYSGVPDETGIAVYFSHTLIEV
jgi:hypothetical protein